VQQGSGFKRLNASRRTDAREPIENGEAQSMLVKSHASSTQTLS
jgi:hypothetical protein